MQLKPKKYILLVVIIALIGLGGYFVFNTDMVRKQTSKLMKVEFIPNQDFNIEHALSVQQKDSIYKDFRKRCPFHFQTVGLAKFSDSSWLFIASEPAPYVHIDSVVKVFQKFNIHAEIKTHPIGYDGWVKDIIVCVGRATSENISNLNKHLSKVLYLSDYKPFTVKLPLDTTRIYFSKQALNYRISLSEIDQWFLKDKEAFIDLQDTSKSFDVPQILKIRKAGVFYSRQPGFVIWCLDKKSDIQKQRTNIRKFALDADLILGAVSDSSTLVIIGRERESDVLELPPLNVETILLLASIKDGELSQSLDINDLLAGKMTNNKDWCPTYLSPQLENTEFGHLLTITDVLLKDWSENGTLSYESYDYPKPPYYPFDRPLFSKLGLNELVYNWNTANTMFAYDYNGMNLYSLNRTGSLPVSYFNSQHSYASIGGNYENTAYDYFSGLCNTDLIRVVQYTSLYQLFIDNNITNKGDTVTYAAKNRASLLFSPTKTLLTNIKNLSAANLDSISQTVSEKNFKQFHYSQLVNQLNEWERNNRQKIPDEQRNEFIKNAQIQNNTGMRYELAALQRELKNLNDNDFSTLCSYLAYPRGSKFSNAAMQRIYRPASQALHAIFSLGKTNLGKLGVDLANVKNYYSNSLKNSYSPWLKMPSLIVSYNSPKLTGGHNLSSKIRRVNSINADKAIVASSRPRYTSYNKSPETPQGETRPPSSPAPSSSKPSTKKTSSYAKPQEPNKAPSPPSSELVRKRSDVISGKGRTKRGF